MTQRSLQPGFTDINAALPEALDEGQPLATSAEIGRLRREIALLTRELAHARTQLTSSEAALAKYSSDLTELAHALKTSRETIDAIFRSRSWRWLSPIRRLNLRLRSTRQRIQLRRFF